MKRMASLVCAATFLGMLLIPGDAAAFKLADLKTIKATKSCANCNLTGADLSGLDLTRADLTGVNLGRARLEKTDLSWARLNGANLSGARLNGADLTGADLNGAKLGGANFSGAIWTDASRCKEGSIGKCRK